MSPPEDQPSDFLHHEPCPKCGSSDANARYSDGHSHCFACGHHTSGDGSAGPARPPKHNPECILRSDQFIEPLRGLTEETLKLWDYCKHDQGDGSRVHVANYKDDSGAVVAQKIRTKSKDFRILGDAKAMGLYGQHLWRSQGKLLVVTEGEIDALSVSQAQGNKWPVVSLPNGAQAAKKAFQKNLEYLLGFDHVVIMFDMDEPGQRAAIEAAEVLPPGRAKIARLPLKDANELLVAGRTKEIIDAIWGAKTYRPDGIVGGSDLWEALEEHAAAPCWTTPWPSWDAAIGGFEKGGYSLFLAGTGIGKSTFMRAIALDLLKQGETVGMMMLEEQPAESLRELLRMSLGQRECSDKTLLRTAYDSLKDRFFLYDHRGETDPETVLRRLEYLIKGCGCGFVVVDNLSVIMASMVGDDERKATDQFVGKLRSLADNANAGILLVNHITAPEGSKGHEEGSQVMLKQSRGSRAPANFARTVIGLERNQQGDDDDKHFTTARLLKCRRTGKTGVMCRMKFDVTTGLLTESATNTSEESY